MNVYIDSSVVLRVVLGESGRLKEWTKVTRPISSELIRVECLRTIDRARIRLSLVDDEVSRRRAELIEMIERFTLVRLDGHVLARAAEPFPTLLGTLGSIHLASAALARASIEGLRFATHDRELAMAATSLGFEVLS